jgi:hypothetical protein
MKLKSLLAILATLAVGWTAQSFGAEAAMSPNNPSPTAAKPHSTPKLRVLVDPRVELVSLLFRLAGNPEYTQGRVPSYTADVEKQFGKVRDHRAVRLARELRNSRGVSYDACMNLAILLTGTSEPALKVPLDPWPDFLDKRWNAQSANSFVAAARQFVKDSGFEEFINAHQQLYKTTESRMQELMDKEGHWEWFNLFFGERPQANFTIILGMLNGGGCYGPHWRDAAGKEELFCVLGVWATDGQGMPVFRKEVLGTVVHEFCHSYANPIIHRHWNELKAPGEKLFQPVADQMRSQAYGNAQTMLCESLVRASVVRYLRHYGGAEAADREIREQKRRGFPWMQDLSDLLGQYETQRDRYPTLESFSPRLVAFFRDYASDFSKEQGALDAKRPKVVSLVPPNGATNVDAGLKAVQVVFDRPMRDGSWSMCGGGPNYPETVGKPHYDTQRTTWSIPVKLKPDWDYEFWLNSGQYQSFQSEKGVPLKSVSVRFRTGPQVTR